MSDATEEAKIEKLPNLNKRHKEFVENYFLPEVEYNATEAYCRTYPKATRESARREASALLTRVDIKKHIAARFAERHMGKDEAIELLSKQARADVGVFYKVAESWVFTPQPFQEVIGEREIIDARDPQQRRMRTQFLVRHIVVDPAVLIDPKYSKLIKKVTVSPRNGLVLELHDPQAANDKVLRTLGAYKDRVALTDPNGDPLNIPDKDADVKFNRAISALADALGESLLGQSPATQSPVDAPEQTPVAGAPIEG